MNNFHNDLAFSESSRTSDFWLKAYKNFFVDFSGWEYCNDLSSQKIGIDRIVYTSGNKRGYYIDEKTRRKFYNDILIEDVSNDNTGAAGWINKDLSIDFLAYAFINVKRVYIFPWPALRRVWHYYGKEWRSNCRKITAKNKGYNTISYAVPTDLLIDKVNKSMVIQL